MAICNDFPVSGKPKRVIFNTQFILELAVAIKT